MSDDLINTSGTCKRCGGKLKNIEGRRLTRAQLSAVHRESCPGIIRKKSP